MLNLIDIKNKWKLNRYFKNSSTKLLYCEVPTSLLLSRLEKNVFKEVSDAIEIGYQTDLAKVDRQLDKVHLCALDTTGGLRTLLKLGYLINELRLNGQKNPIQLVASTQPEFYKVHPGTVRVVVSSYIFENEQTKLIYCWNEKLEPNLFLLDYVTDIIDTSSKFLKLHPIKTEVKTKELNEHTKYVDPNKVINFYGMQLQGLNAQHSKFNFNFLTTFDSWKPSLESRIKFRDIVKYEKDKCVLSGVRFKKVKGMWFKSD